MRIRLFRAAAMLSALALVVMACAPDDDPAADAPEPAEAPEAAEAPEPEEPEEPEDEDPWAEVAEFYSENDITIMVGFGPGGVFGLVSELVAEHIGQYIPGNPTVTTDFRPGAVSLVNANAVYNTDPQDGTILGSIHENLTIQQVMGLDEIEFDMGEFQWLGSTMHAYNACAARTDMGIDTLEDLMNGQELIVGAGTRGGANFDVPVVLSGLLGANFTIIGGYDGAGDIGLAIERGEVDGVCGTSPTFEGAAFANLLDEGVIKMIAAYGDIPEGHQLLADVEEWTRVEDLVDDADDQAVLALTSAAGSINRGFVMAPGVPEDRVMAIREAFMQLAEDDDFLAAGLEAGIDFDIKDWQTVEDVVAGILATPPEAGAEFEALLDAAE